MKPSLSFVIPVRGRIKVQQELISHLNKYYQDFEIIFVEQCDSFEFLKGQLFNIGFRYVNSQIVILLDVDVRIGKIDFINLMQKHKHPIIPFNVLDRGNLLENGSYEITKQGKPCKDIGGVACVTVKQFSDCNGYSNLLFGYGYEDHLLNNRLKLKRVNNTIFHIEHPVEKKNRELINWNGEMVKTDSMRDKNKDGLKQTVVREMNVMIEKNVLHVFCEDIYVTDDFQYMDLYRQGLEIVR